MRRSDQRCLSRCQRHIKNPFFERVVFPIKTDSGPILVKRHLACEKTNFIFWLSDLKKMLTNVKEVSVSPRPRGSLFCLFRKETLLLVNRSCN